MNATLAAGFVLLGVLSGFFSGLLGIGGAAIIIPVLVLALHFEQHAAQGTTLVMLSLPLGLLPAFEYWKSGHVRIGAALWMSAGFLLGSIAGAMAAVRLPVAVLQRVFGFVMLGVALRFIFAR